MIIQGRGATVSGIKEAAKMICYAVKRINLKHVNNVAEYWEAVKKVPVHYCNGIIELKEYCGGILHRERSGYTGICGDTMYVAEKV